MNEHDLMQLFQQLFIAKREVAVAESRATHLEHELAAAKIDLEQAKAHESGLLERLNHEAARAAGVAVTWRESEGLPVRADRYVPIR